MKNSLEYILIICLIVGAFLIKETADIPKTYLVYSGCIIVLFIVVIGLWLDRRRAGALRFFPWLYTCDATLPASHTIRKIEVKAKSYSIIYLVSADLYNDARSSETQKVVQSNLERSITYKYIVRNDNEISECNINEVMHRFSDFHKNVKIFAINEIFGMLPTRNVLIIEHDEFNRLRVFVELPVVENNVCNWWVEADAVVARQWHKKVLEILQGKQSLPQLY